MGGNSFKNDIPQRRIDRDEIIPTVTDMIDTLRLFDLGMTRGEFVRGFMGSTLKADTSGDIDIALQQVDVRPFVRHDAMYTWANMLEMAARARLVVGEQAVRVHTNQREVQVLWPIAADGEHSIQMDITLGDREWLQFSHASGGADRSRFKGAYKNGLLGVVAKTRVLYANGNKREEDTRRVQYYFDTGRGLRTVWRASWKGRRLEPVDAELFETMTPDAPRFPHNDFITDPFVATRLMFEDGLTPMDVETMESAWLHCCRIFDRETLATIKSRTVDAVCRMMKVKDPTAVADDELWRGVPYIAKATN